MILTLFSNLAYGFSHNKLIFLWYILGVIAVSFGIYNFFYELGDVYKALFSNGFMYFIKNINVLGR